MGFEMMDMDQESQSSQRADNADTTIHPFNASALNDTVMEIAEVKLDHCPKSNSCEGSDSGVEVIESCPLERQEFETLTPAQSCDSSIISCCSNYEDAFNVLVRRNSTLLDDYKLRCVDGMSENGSESSSVASTTKNSKRPGSLSSKKKTSLAQATPPTLRSRTKPPITPRPSTLPNRTKSSDRSSTGTPRTLKTTTRAKPSSCDAVNLKKEVLIGNSKKCTSRTPLQTRSNITTPTDDGRWPSNFSKPAPTMTRSLRGILPNAKEAKSTIEKYATLPRRHKERVVDSSASGDDCRRALSRENSVTRSCSLRRRDVSNIRTPVSVSKLKGLKTSAHKTRIYHETASQTALDCKDIEKALAGVHFNPINPQDVEKSSKESQVDIPDERLKQLEEQLNAMKVKYDALQEKHTKCCKTSDEAKVELMQERLEKEGLKQELKTNNERLTSMLSCYGINNLDDADSLKVLDTKLQKVSHVIINQENEISKLNEFCRSLQRSLDKAMESNRCLEQQQQEHEDLQEFLQIEKNSLGEALKESDTELQRARNTLAHCEQELDDKHEECKHLVRAVEQKRQENLGLQARFTALEAKCRELLVHQGSTVSGAAVALTSLNARLESLVDQLTTSYNFTDEELDDVIFHNEAYSNSSSSPDATPDKPDKSRVPGSPLPGAGKRGSSLIAAVIGAIKNATTPSTFNRENSKDTLTDNSENSAELLDSETEPCLMMEHVLEDVVVPDCHSVNMISSGHSMISSLRLSHTESLNSLSQAIRNRERCEAAAVLKADTTLSDLSASHVSLVDQVIDADNLLTRLLKIIRIVQTENEEYMNELQDERDNYVEQVTSHRESNKIVARQLKDWECLGAKLKSEVKELLAQLAKKNGEIEGIKNDLNAQRQEVEKLNQDVCQLSTALSKRELTMRMRDEEASEALRNWESDGEVPSGLLLGRLLLLRKELPACEEKLEQREKQLCELTQEYVANRQVLTENLREAITEAKKQYNAIDSALETLQSIQVVVQQCPALLKLQHDLEERSFQSASAMPLVVPPDFNANAAILQAMGNLAINSSA